MKSVLKDLTGSNQRDKGVRISTERCKLSDHEKAASRHAHQSALRASRSTATRQKTQIHGNHRSLARQLPQLEMIRKALRVDDPFLRFERGLVKTTQ